MEPIARLLRLGVAGLLLDPAAFRAQRESPAALRDGFLLVALIGLLVGVAATIGSGIAMLATPAPATVLDTVRRGVEATPFYQQLVAINPDVSLDESFAALNDSLAGAQWAGLIGAVATPLSHLLGWLIYGTFSHLIARALGGRATLGQTLGCTALASGANLLALAQVVPFAQAGGGLLGLIGCYLAIRTAHDLPAWRAFWATLLGPLLLGLLAALLACGLFFALISAAQGA